MNFSFRFVLEKKSPSVFYAGGRSGTSHLTLTQPDQQPVLVNPTGFHLWFKDVTVRWLVGF